MFASTLLTLLVFMPSNSNALPKPQGGGRFSNPGPTTGGTAPFSPGTLTTTPSLPNHTLCHPSAHPPNVKLPVLIWGNSACAADGTAFLSLLTQLVEAYEVAVGDEEGRVGVFGVFNSGLLDGEEAKRVMPG